MAEITVVRERRLRKTVIDVHSEILFSHKRKKEKMLLTGKLMEVKIVLLK